LTAAARSPERTVNFRVGKASVAIAAADVAEIVRRPEMIRVPHGPSRLVGLANLRGRATLIFSLAGLLGQPHREDEAWAVVLNGNPALGLLADSVESMSDAADVTPGTLDVTVAGEHRSVSLTDLLAGQAAALPAGSAIRSADLPQAADMQRDEKRIGLLSFTLAGQNYALPLADIVEVAPLPARVKAGRGASLGRVTIRGRKVALISLRVLLGLGDAAVGGQERVIVVDLDGERTGLVVDGARAILRAPETSVGAAPALLNRESDAARIQSVVRMPDGRGVASVLTVASLFHGDVKETEDTAASPPERAAAAEDTHRFVIFRIGGEDYGYPIEAIGEIVRQPESMSRVPGAPDYVAGAVNLRGTVVPILDQRRRFGAAPADADRDGRILVVDVGGVRTGLLVDRVAAIREIPAGQIGAAPELSAGSRRLFDRVITAQQDEHMILVVDPDTLLSRAELDQLAAINADAAEAAHP